MPASANLPPRRKGPALPLLVSVAVHGILLSALWFAPSRPSGVRLAIESTRICLDACSIDSGEPNPKPEREFSPQLIEAPIAPSPPASFAGPTLSIPSHAFRPATSAGSSGGGPTAITGSLFPLPATAASVVYVLDRSMSMGIGNKLEPACRELLASLRRLPARTLFQIIAYNNAAEPLFIAGRNDLLPAEPPFVAEAAQIVEHLTPRGPTDHVKALRRALALRPDVLFFLTDADDLPAAQIDLLTRCNRGTVIHTIELSPGRQPRPDGALARLAKANGGSYRRVPIGNQIHP